MGSDALWAVSNCQDCWESNMEDTTTVVVVGLLLALALIALMVSADRKGR